MHLPLFPSILGVFLLSCASTPVNPAGEPTTTPSPAAPVARVPTVQPDTPSVTPQAEPRKKLEAGQCLESFDCVDTVGFPPSGHRWTCLDGKCGKAKLPDLGQDQTASDAAASTASNEETPATRAVSRKHKSKHQ
jgi:hypothetical protein